MNDTQLCLVDKNDLQYNECRIEKGKAAFLDVADALMAIRDRKLYRAGFSTFEKYCKDRWQLGRNYVNKLIGSASAVKSLPADLGTIVPNEGTAREIAKIEPARRDEVVRQAAERAQDQGRKLTAGDVAEAAQPADPAERPAVKEKSKFDFDEWRERMAGQLRTLLIDTPKIFRTGACANIQDFTSHFSWREEELNPVPQGSDGRLIAQDVIECFVSVCDGDEKAMALIKVRDYCVRELSEMGVLA